VQICDVALNENVSINTFENNRGSSVIAGNICVSSGNNDLMDSGISGSEIFQ
jgi:hypothetical protein